MKDESLARKTLRIDSIDLLRGIVMVIMMLDHTRDFVHYGALSLNPLDLRQTNTLLFLTRWITHYCAPTFVFLAGTGAYLQLARGKSKSELSRFLISRGLWLIVLEFTVVRLVAFFNVDRGFLGILQVIWVIGVSMIVLAGLIHLPLKVTAGFGLAMIFLHNLLDKYQVVGMRPGSPVPSAGTKLWMVLHQLGLFPITGSGSPIVFLNYPLIPWIGVMAVGYALGALYQKEASIRRRWLLIIGGVATALFVIIRAFDSYGEPLQWSRQNNLVFTILSFVNTTKYPPSLLFLLMTLGPAILALAWFESRNESMGPPDSSSQEIRGRVRNFFVTFGRVPLFFYLLQWITAHTISIVLHLVFGKPYGWLFETPVQWFSTPHPGIGFNLAVVYACWIAGVILLYPLCKWFAGVKQRRRDWWLSYL
jgi:uncharacterized membrane protein